MGVSSGGARTTRHCDNFRGRLVREGAGPNGTVDLEEGVFWEGVVD